VWRQLKEAYHKYERRQKRASSSRGGVLVADSTGVKTGRSAYQFHVGSLSRRSPSLRRELDEAYLEINPFDAGEPGVAEGEAVKVSSRSGEIEVKAKLTNNIEKGTLFIPFHFAESAANALTNPALDPVAKIPEFKVCAVRVEKLKQGGK